MSSHVGFAWLSLFVMTWICKIHLKPLTNDLFRSIVHEISKNVLENREYAS